MMDDMLCPTSERIIPDLSNLNSFAPSECVACVTWIVPTPVGEIFYVENRPYFDRLCRSCYMSIINKEKRYI